MPALAMGLGWAGYALGLWGYCLVKGYDVTLMQLIDFRHVPAWQAITASKIPDGQTWPTGQGTTQAPARLAFDKNVGQFLGGFLGDKNLLGKRKKAA